MVPVSYVEVNLKENFLLVKIKSMQEPLPLKQVFVLIKLITPLLLRNPLVGSKLKHPISSDYHNCLQNNQYFW